MSAIKPPTRSEMKFLGESLITFGDNNCLGDLIHFEGRGTYDPTLGLVDVTKEEADIHNKALDEARLKGLDESCEVGQGGYFYQGGDGWVTTFIGTRVARYSLTGSTITFERAGKRYRGRLSKHSEAFNFTRVK